MLIQELAEQEAFREFAEHGPETAAALVKFFHEHYGAPDAHAEYMHHVVNSVVEITIGYYQTLSKDKRASFLKCLANFFKVALAMRGWDARLSATDIAEQLSQKPLFFASLAEMIEPLESIQKGLQEIDPHLPSRRVLLVEGDAEANFIQTIQMHATVANFDFSVYLYRGTSPKTVRNLVGLLQSIFSLAVDNDLIPRSPVRDRLKPRVTRC